MNNAKTILVVEDERSLLEAIKLKLVERGFNAVTARSVDQALSLLQSTPNIDAIWLDHYVLGGEDGLDLVSRLKSEGADWVNIPIFVVSNTASNEKVTAYMQLGINKYYIKSNYRLDQIIAEIQEELNYGNN